MKAHEKVQNTMVVYVLLILINMTTTCLSAQQLEVEGALKVTQMNVDNTQDNLVVRNSDGTLGTRGVASLPSSQSSSPGIDTTRNLASDFELAKLLCNCYNLPPFMIKKLLDSGYTPEELVGSGIAVQQVIDAQRGGVMIDPRDNKSYKTVTIGTQTWMAENLNFGMRVDGSADQTDNNIIEKYCYNDDPFNCNIYGGLYQWNEMMQYSNIEGLQGVCPTGWHLPTDDEWKTLEMELGMTQSEADATGFRGTNQGSQLAGNETLWNSGLLVQNGFFNSSGFTALPGGNRTTSGSFFNQSNQGFIWSSSESGGNAWGRNLNYNNPKVYRIDYPKLYGFSVSCVQD